VQTEHRRRGPRSHRGSRARNSRNPFGTERHPHYTHLTGRGPRNYRITKGEKSTRTRPHPQHRVEIIAGQSCRRFNRNYQRQPATLPLSVPMEMSKCDFHPQARERSEISPKLSPHQSSPERR
jgi:hypothetical protein